MEYRKLGESGIEASVVCFGAWAIGGWLWGGTEEEESVRAIHAALDAGINCIDTAPIYGFGRSEEIVARAIADRRDKVVLATKCGMIWHEEMGEPVFKSTAQEIDNERGDIDVYKCLRPESLRYEVEQSLKRLKTDYIDLYQTHWQESTTPLEDTMATLLALRDEGKIRAVGCCNVDIDQIKHYDKLGPTASAQQRYSMLDREYEADVLPYCQEHDIAVLAYSPLSLGLLTGKVPPEREFPEGDLRRSNPRFTPENRRRVLDMLAEIRPIAEAHGLTLAQLAIAWTVQQPGLSHALVGARNEQQARENAAAGAARLAPDELQAIRSAIDEFFGDEA